MTVIVALLATFWLAASALHAVSIVAVMVRVRRAKRAVPSRVVAGLVSIVRPVAGLDSYTTDALRSGFALNDPAYEILFCAHAKSDPVVPVVRNLMASYPLVSAKQLIGDSNLYVNPKLNNLAKSWPEISGEWIIFCDGNVILEPDYIERLFEEWGASTGAVSSIHLGTAPKNFWAEVECAFLNGFHARSYLTAAAAGFGFAHGKTILLRHRDLQASGGMESLASEIAEDAAVTRLVHNLGLRVSVSFKPVVQPVGERSAREVFDRQARWARLRKQCYPSVFLPELLAGGVFPIVAVACLTYLLGGNAILAALGQAVFWYGAESMLLIVAGWHFSWRVPLASVVRDLMIPIVWTYAWFGREFRWGDKVVYGERA